MGKKKKKKKPKKKKTTNKTTNPHQTNKSIFVFLSLLIPIVGLMFHYFISRPNIIIDNINAIDENPFKHEFTIKNIGKTKAYTLQIDFLNPNFVTKNNITFGTYGQKDKAAVITEFSRIEDIIMVPGQSYSFIPQVFSDRFSPKEAVLTLRFRYKDIFHIPYSHKIHYRTFIEGNRLIWKTISQNNQKLNK